MDGIFQLHIFIVSSKMREVSKNAHGKRRGQSLKARMNDANEKTNATSSTHRFSRNVFAFALFLPMAQALYAQNAADGSI
jgi:hypothetical protein